MAKIRAKSMVQAASRCAAILLIATLAPLTQATNYTYSCSKGGVAHSPGTRFV